MDQPVPKRKRGRPPKIMKDNILIPIELPASHLPEYNARLLQFGYKIIQDIVKLSKTKHLLDMPDENLFGLHNYYHKIEAPIWLNEVLRKFSAQEYTGVCQVINDIRRILENCYKFWGSKHKFSKQAFRIEKFLEKQLRGAPQTVRELCEIELSEDENSIGSENDSSFFVEEFSSKILKNIEKKEKEESLQDKLYDEEKKAELFKWESEVLLIEQHQKQMLYLPELSEIGHFLLLSHDFLCLSEVSQYEIERMLLIPKESSTLATIMTSLLCPSAMRGNLYLKPVMCYEVWSKFLSRKLDMWYNHYHKNNNKAQLFARHGIEINFWEAVGERNPLLKNDFASLPFQKRAWVLKTLCTTMFHSYKKIEEYFSSLDDVCLRGTNVYEDGKFVYISLFSPEIRVYRTCKAQIDIDTAGEPVAVVPVKANNSSGEQVQLPIGKKYHFHLAAYDKASLESLIKVFSQKKKSLSAIKKLLLNVSSEKISLMALSCMKHQWERNKERSDVCITRSIKYWIDKEREICPGDPLTPNSQMSLSLQTPSNSFSNSLTNSSVLSSIGKRTLKRKFSVEDLEDSSDSSIGGTADADGLVDSDWEEGNLNKNKRNKTQTLRPRPLLPHNYLSLMRWEGEKDAAEKMRLCNNAMKQFLPLMPPDMPQVKKYTPRSRNIMSFPDILNARSNLLGVKILKTSVRRPSIVAAAVENAAVGVNEENESPVDEGKVLTINLTSVSSGV